MIKKSKDWYQNRTNQHTFKEQEEQNMSLFEKKEKIFLSSEEQKDELIEKLENAHVKYVLRIDKDSVNIGHTSYVVTLKASDYEKVD